MSTLTHECVNKQIAALMGRMGREAKPGSAADPVRLAVSEALHEEYDISHATLQMEAHG